MLVINILENVVRLADALSIALAREDAVAAVWIRGRLVFERGMLQAK
ncbi:hypothetical protein [Thiolapillus sp.]